MESVVGVVLAAGEGKRFRSAYPKVLHKVCGVPMVNLVVRALKEAGIRDIIVVVGRGKEEVEKVLPPDVKRAYQIQQLGTAHAVNCVKDILPKRIKTLFVTYGDMPLLTGRTIRRFVKFHLKSKVDCSITTGFMDDPQGYGRILRDEKGRIIGIREDKDASGEVKEIKEVNTGLYCFTSEILFKFIGKIKRNNRQKEYYLTDIIKLFVANNVSITSFQIENFSEVLGVNSRKELALANKILNRILLETHMEKGVTILDPDTTYIDVNVMIGRDTVIYPCTVIEGKVRIGKGCHVGPFTHLRDNTVLKDGSEIGNFVEVKKSTIGKFTKAKHLTYLGDAILGEQVNVGAGTITANYDGKNKYPTYIGNRCFIGSHTTLVAPVKVGKGAITGAGSVVLKNRDVPPNAVVVGVPAKILKKREVDGRTS